MKMARLNWIIDTMLSPQEDLIRSLEELGCEYSLVKKIPFCSDIVDQNGNILDKSVTRNSFVIGPSSMKEFSDKHDLKIGYIRGMDYSELIELLGRDVLNHDVSLMRIKDIIDSNELEGNYFVRPNEDSKIFSGQVVSSSSIKDYCAKYLKHGDSNLFNEDTVLCIGSVKEILSEWRVLLVGGKFVTSSLYRRGGLTKIEESSPISLINYVNEISGKAGLETTCLDIASTPYGWRVIETNSISGCGFYDCDMNKFVNAMENYYG